MESNGHDEPFKDKSNALDILCGPEASPLPSPPPRRKSLVGLKGIMATRRSWWENQTTSVGNSGVNPLSQSLPGIQPTLSQNSLRSIVSTANRKFRDQQENFEVTSSYVKPAAGREGRAASKLACASESLAPVESPVKCSSEACDDAAEDLKPDLLPIQYEIGGSTVPGSPVGAATTVDAPSAQEDEGNCCSNQNSAPGSPLAAAEPDEPYWKKFSSVWKKTPVTDRKPHVTPETSLCAAATPQNVPAATAEPSLCNNLQPSKCPVSSLEIENEQGNPVHTTNGTSPTQDLQSPTSVESLSPNYSEAREAEPHRCSEVKMMKLNCMSENIQDLTTYSDKLDNIVNEWGNSPVPVVDADAQLLHSPDLNECHSSEQAHTTIVSNAPGSNGDVDMTDTEMHVQLPSSPSATDQHSQLLDVQEPPNHALQPAAVDSECVIDPSLESHDTEHQKSETAEKAAVDVAVAVVETVHEPSEQPASARRKPAPLKLQEGCSVQEMAYSAGLSPTSSPTRVRAASSLDFEVDIENAQPMPESFAVDVSLDTPPLHVDSMPEPEPMDADSSMPDNNVQEITTEQAVAASPHRSTVPSMPAVFDSFSFGGPSMTADGTVADDVVASLAQLPFSGLATLGTGTHSKQYMGSSELDLHPPEASEEPATCLHSGTDTQPKEAECLQVSLADGCGIEMAKAKCAPLAKLDGTAVQSLPSALAQMFNSVDSSMAGSVASDCGQHCSADQNNAAVAVAVDTVLTTADTALTTEGPAEVSSKNVYAGVSGDDSAVASPVHAFGGHPTSSMLPPRHPSPGPRIDGGDAAKSPITICPGVSPGQSIGIREAVEQVLQSSPTAKVRNASPAASRRAVGRVGDSIPLFVKDLQTESLLDDTNMDDWLSPSTVQPKSYNHLLDDPETVGDAADIEKVCDSIRAAAEVDAARMSNAAEDMHMKSNFTGSPAQQLASLHAPAASQPSTHSASRMVNSPSQSAGTAPASAGNTVTHREETTADASSRRPSLAPASTSALKSPRAARPVASHIAPNKSPRGVPMATSAKSVPSKPAGPSAPLKSPRRVPGLAAAAATTTAATKSPPRMSMPAPSATKPTGRPSISNGSAPLKSPRGVPVSKPIVTKPASRVLPSAASAGSSVAKTPRGTISTTASSIPKAQRVSSLPSAPQPKTPRNSNVGGAAAPNKATHIPSKLAGPKVSSRNAAATTTLKTPRGSIPAVPSAAATAKPTVPTSKPSAKTHEPESGSTTPRQNSLKRPLSSPVSANRVRTGRPVPVTPKMDTCPDVHMEDAESPALGLATEPIRESADIDNRPQSAAVPRLNLNPVLKESDEAVQSNKQQQEAEDKTEAKKPVPEQENAEKPPAASIDFGKTPARNLLGSTSTPLESWTPELYMPPSSTPATTVVVPNKGLDVYNANMQATPFRMLSNVQLDAAVNAPLIDSSPLCWDEQDFDNDTQKILMQLAVSPAPANLGVKGSQHVDDHNREPSPAPNSLMEMQVQMLLQQVSDYKTKMQQLETDNLALKDQISTLQFGKEFEKGEDEFEKDARLYAEAELHKVQAQNTQLSSRVQQLEKEAEDLKTTKEDLTSRNETLEKERNKALDQLGFMEVEVTALRSALSEHQQLLTAEQSKATELDAALVTEQEQRVKLIKEISELKKDMKKLMEQLISAQTEHKVALKEVENAHVLVSKLQREKAAETVKVAQLNTHLEASKAEAKELMAMCSELLAVQEASMAR